VLLRIQVFWDVMLCPAMNGYPSWNLVEEETEEQVM
jgi:hypothetical protein